MKKSGFLLISPYAQALKHVALRGQTALRTTPKQSEYLLYQQSVLPADYKVPSESQWDDTVERWAYAWQFPLKEGGDPESVRVGKLPGMGQLTEFTRKLISDVQNIIDEKRHDNQKAVELSPQIQLPLAFIDDGSDLSRASKELGGILVDELALPFSPAGIVTCIAALSHAKLLAEAEALFNFSSRVGFAPTCSTFCALMSGYASEGNANKCIVLVEEMKSRGITPTRTAWHTLMKAFMRSRDYPAAIQIVDNMKAYANIEPDEVTFQLHLNALASDKSRESNVFDAIQLFDQMENVYGFVPTRGLYHAILRNLAYSSLPEMRTRVEEISKKMELLGILWDSQTYELVLQSSAIHGDIHAVKELFSKMRDEKIEMSINHLQKAVSCYANSMLPHIFDYETLKARNESPLPMWIGNVTTCFKLYDLVARRGWGPTRGFIDSLLRLSTIVTILSTEYLPEDETSQHKFETQCTALWNETYKELKLERGSVSYEHYITMLAHQLRIDEAEKLFQELILQKDLVPTRRTYEALMYMHLMSGEEGGTARALSYMEAMERAHIPLRASTIRKFTRISNQASYRRDMLRRARRIMQAREEYLRRKAEGEAQCRDDDGAPSTSGTTELSPIPLNTSSTLAWWEKWKTATISKHELFDKERPDGMPRGETFEEKNEALRRMGIESTFLTKSALPDLSRHTLLPKLRSDGSEPAGSLWALDGGDLTYPERGAGPDGWGVRLWRDRQVLHKEIAKISSGQSQPLPLSATGNSRRNVPDQLLIEKVGAKTPGELADAKQFPKHVYEDGKPKQQSEIAFKVSPMSELVWVQEKKDDLSHFKTDEEILLENDNDYLNSVVRDTSQKVSEAIDTVKQKKEGEVDVIGRGTTRRSKYDYLEKFREMYRFGTLEVPEDPIIRFGRSPSDHDDTVANTIRAWFNRRRRHPATDAELAQWRNDVSRCRDYNAARGNLKQRPMR